MRQAVQLLLSLLLWMLTSGTRQQQTDANSPSSITNGWQPVVNDFQENICVDTELEGAPFNCDEYAQRGLCYVLPKDVCQKSCNACPCEDTLLQGMSDCNKVVQQNLCEDVLFRGKYCQKSCGFCSYIVEVEQIVNVDECEQTDAIHCDLNALQSFKDTIYEGQNIFSSWQGDDPCRWTYITCSDVDGQNRRVTKIYLNFAYTSYSQAMAGKIVPDFSKLRFLQDFRLSNQAGIRGQFFPEYSVLGKLTHFLIWRTSVSGTYPPEYSVWTNLKHFTGSHNQINGTIPSQFSTWKFLQRLFIGGGNLKGQLPIQFSEWRDLNIFNARSNIFTGTLPPEYSTMSKLYDLYLRENRLSGTLPPEYSTMKNMTDFVVYNAKLSGTLPPQYSTMSNSITIFQSYGNSITSNFPIEWSVWRQNNNPDVRL